MLSQKAEYCWENTHHRLEAAGTVVTGVNFKIEFLEKCFPTDVCSRKEIEFLELKQGNMIIADYQTKFEELSRFCPHYNDVDAEGSNCMKFDS